MREIGGRAGGNVVAAAVAVLEKQALSSTCARPPPARPTPSVKTQTPQDNLPAGSAPPKPDRRFSPETERSSSESRTSGSPLTRSESFKKIVLNGDGPEEFLPKSGVSKVTVIGAKLKQNVSANKEVAFAQSASDVDALCSDLMSNLEEAIGEKKPNGTSNYHYDSSPSKSNGSSTYHYLSDKDPPKPNGAFKYQPLSDRETCTNKTNGSSTSHYDFEPFKSNGSPSYQYLSDQDSNHSYQLLNERDLTKSSRSGFAYVDLRESRSRDDYSDGVVLRRHFETTSNGVENRHSSSTNESAVTSEDFDSDNESDESSEETTESETDSSDSDVARVHVVNEGLETITEEERPVTASSARTTEEGGDSSSPDDESTLKGNATWSGTASNHDSTSDLSTSSSGLQKLRQDSTTCCNEDFKWIRKSPSESPAKMDEAVTQQQQHNTTSKPPINRQVRDRTPRRHVSDKAPGSLDRRRHHHQNRHERDQKSKSTHVPKSPSRIEENAFPACQNWCCNPHVKDPTPPPFFDNFHRRHERVDPQRYGSSSMLLEQARHDFYGNHGSHPDLYSDCRYRHEPVGCCSYHAPPPCCRCSDNRNYHWTPPTKPPDHDDRLRRLQSENDNLQKEVFVLNERIEAQSDKISELEKMLAEKKQQLGSAEDLLQREMLSRSSLETQKLELMSAMSELKLQQAALERENCELRNSQYNNNTVALLGVKKPPLKPRASPQPQHTSTPILHTSNQMLPSGLSPSPSPMSAGNLVALTQRRTDMSPVQQDVQPPKTPPASYRRQIDLHYGSLPRQQFISNGGAITAVDTNANPANGARKGVAFGKGFSSLLGVRARGHSVPNLAETEKIVIEDTPNESTNNLSPQPSPSLQINKNRGIKKIFGRMKRSGSGNLEDLPGEGEFRRGGIRATAGPRLGWNDTQKIQKPSIPFADWDVDAICDWLQDLGLDTYIPEAKRWVKNGAHLQAASVHDMDKELGIKNLLHRKKLQLALIDTQENSSSDPYLSAAGQLDTSWVLRWLDDTGLPQHKEAFLTNRVDGRVLHRLTMDDLAALHITSVLHVASLKRGIQVLREHNFEPGCLQRRSLPDDPSQPTPQQVALWTTHRVMEWLRAVDLAEYAPNLRGAGVHGGLMVLEPKFTAELLATLLSIPPSKTLLRRHLNTHFKELLGRDVIQEKREAETTLGYTPLTPAAKVKVTKKSQFSLKKKKDKGEMDYGDLVCPLNTTGSQSGESNGSSSTSTSRDSVGTTKTDGPKGEVVCHLIDDPALADEDSYQSSSSPVPARNMV